MNSFLFFLRISKRQPLLSHQKPIMYKGKSVFGITGIIYSNSLSHLGPLEYAGLNSHGLMLRYNLPQVCRFFFFSAVII